ALPILEVDASVVPGGDELFVSAGDLGEDSGAGAAGDPGLDFSGFVVKSVLAGAKAGAVDVAIGVQVDQTLAPLVDLPQGFEERAIALVLVAGVEAGHGRSGDGVGEHPADQIPHVLLELRGADADPAAAVEARPLPAGVGSSSALALERPHPPAAEPAAHQARQRVRPALAGFRPRRRQRHSERLVPLLGDDRLPLTLGDHHALVLAQAG